MKYIIVRTESYDWFVIPADKETEWHEVYKHENNLPEWAIWIHDDPSNLSFNEYEIKP